VTYWTCNLVGFALEMHDELLDHREAAGSKHFDLERLQYFNERGDLEHEVVEERINLKRH